MKKIFIFMSAIIAALSLNTGVIGTQLAFAETDPSNEPITETVKTGTVIIEKNDGGDVIADIENGNVGDTVTLLVKPDLLYVIKTITINGIACEKKSNGNYTFQLIEGNNLVKVEFEISNEKLTEIAQLIKDAQENGVTSLFTVSNLLNLITWVISVFLSSGFFITLIKNKKIKSKTVEEVSNVVIETLESQNAKALKEFLNNLVSPTLNSITDKMDGVDECIKVMCRCMILAQDDTPENRLAIINELTKLSNSDEALTAQIRSIVQEEQKAQEEKIAARDKAIEELKENNANLVTSDNSSIDTNGDNYGIL